MELHCEFRDINRYFCEVKKVTKTNAGPADKIIISGEHAEGRNNKDVETCIISFVRLGSFPRGLHKVFPKLTHLFLEDIGLEKISRKDLVGLENLETLHLSNNDLDYIPVNLFVGMRKLRSIDLYGDMPMSLNLKVLKPIEANLEYAGITFSSEMNDFIMKILRNKEAFRCIMYLFEPRCRFPEMNYIFSKFRASGELSDFTIRACGKEFKVHKVLLAGQSSVFRKMYTSGDASIEENFKKVKSFSDASFESFVDFFYSGKINDEVNALEVFELATVFDVASLKSILTDKILMSLCPANAFETYNVGNHHGSYELKREAFEVIQQIWPEVPDSMLENSGYINKLAELKREIDAILDSAKKVEANG